MSESSNSPGEGAGDHRSIDLTRIGKARFKATNGRGGQLPIGSGRDPDFTPGELLLAALAACTSIDVDLITGKRAQPVVFDARAEGDKVRDEHGNHLTGLRVTLDVRFPEGDAGDAAREALPRALRQSAERLCTVGRTVAAGEQVDYREADLSGS